MEQIKSRSEGSELPFSEAIRHGDTIYVSGQGPIDTDTREIVGSTPEEQVDQTLDNIEHILAAGDSSLDSIVNTTVYPRRIDERPSRARVDSYD